MFQEYRIIVLEPRNVEQEFPTTSGVGAHPPATLELATMAMDLAVEDVFLLLRDAGDKSQGPRVPRHITHQATQVHVFGYSCFGGNVDFPLPCSDFDNRQATARVEDGRMQIGNEVADAQRGKIAESFRLCS